MARVGLWIDWSGAANNAKWGLYFDGTVTGGTYALSWGGDTTTAIAWDATLGEIRDALAALPSIGTDNIAVAYDEDEDVTLAAQGYGDFAFVGALGWAVEADPTVGDDSLTGGGAVVIYSDEDGVAPSAYADVTGYVQQISYHRGGSYEITGAAQVGGATIVMTNPEGLFTPENAASPLFGFLEPGKRVWFGINDDGTLDVGRNVKGRFSGRILDISPIPERGPPDTRTVEITCEDAFGRWARKKMATFVTGPLIGNSEMRSQGDLRTAIWTAASYEFNIGSNTDKIASPEITPLQVSYVEPETAALDALSAINAANGTRHFIKPADDPTLRDIYVARNRHWKLGSTGDAVLRHVRSVSGWRESGDGVINQQAASAEPVGFLLGLRKLWEYDGLPLTVDSAVTYSAIYGPGVFSLTTQLADVAVDPAFPVIGVEYTGVVPEWGVSIVGSMFSFQIRVTSGVAVFSRLELWAREGIREATEGIVVDDQASQDPTLHSWGVLAGPPISGFLVGVLPSARAIASHIVWRYAQPKKRPQVTVLNWLPELTEVDLYDTVSFSLPQLRVTDMVMEIVGLSESVWTRKRSVPARIETTLTLQESRVQDGKRFFRWGDNYDDPDHLMAY